MTVEENLAAQRGLYGAPVGETAGTVMTALGLSQARLAQVLGLSAPMLSQLMSGQRVKIGNPGVLQRFQSISILAQEAPGLSGAEVERRLAALRDEPVTLTGMAPAAAHLRTLATREELLELADRAPNARLAHFLRQAARGAADG